MGKTGSNFKSIWNENYKIHSYEVDRWKALTIEKICSYFQESAWNHAENLKLGFSELAKKSKLWVLFKLKIDILKRPVWGELVKIKT